MQTVDPLTIAERKLSGLCLTCGEDKKWYGGSLVRYIKIRKKLPVGPVCFDKDCGRKAEDIWTK